MFGGLHRERRPAGLAACTPQPSRPCLCPQVRIWDIPANGVRQSLTRARKTLVGHSRRVSLIEWHPTAENLLLSSAYDYKVESSVGPSTHEITPPPPHQDYYSEPFPCPASPQVLLWDVSQVGAVLRSPIRVVLRPVYHRYPSEALLLSVSFNADGSRLVVTSKDRRVRVLDPRTGTILQVGL